LVRLGRGRFSGLRIFRFDPFELPRFHETVSEENPVEVVQLVLDCLSSEVGTLEALLFTFAVAVFNFNGDRPLHPAPISRNAQATLVNHPFPFPLGYFRVNENYERSVRWFNNSNAQRFADLGGGESNAVAGRVQCINHGIDETQYRGVDSGDPLGLLAQDRVGNGPDSKDSHGA